MGKVPGMFDDPGHELGGDSGGRDDQVALVFAVAVVEHEQTLALAEAGERILDGVGLEPAAAAARVVFSCR